MSDFWDRRFSETPEAYGAAPNPFLVEAASVIPEGSTVYVPGGGYGRNALWLARQGHRVIMADSSGVGVQLARHSAESESLPLEAVRADLQVYRPPACDAVVAIYVHMKPDVRESAHRAAWNALRPGGHFIMEAFTTAQLRRGTGGPKDPAMLFTPSMLRTDLPEAEFILLEERTVEIDQGRFHRGAAEVLRLLARKPNRDAPGRTPIVSSKRKKPLDNVAD